LFSGGNVPAIFMESFRRATARRFVGIEKR
jgi:hypothetical protein